MYDPNRSRWGKMVQHYGNVDRKRGVLQLIYGQFSSGKSTYCASAPHVVFLDQDRGDNTDMQARDLPYFTFKTEGLYDNMKAFLLNLRDRKDIFDPEGGPLKDIESLAVDSWTKINEGLLLEITGEDTLENSKPSWDAYMRLKNRQILLVRLLKEIVFSGINVIVTALPLVEGDEAEKLTKDSKDASAKSGFTTVNGMPNLVGAFKRQIGAEFDEVYFLEVVESGGTRHRRIWTVPHESYQAKSRADLPPSIMDPTFESLRVMSEKIFNERVKKLQK